MMKLRETATGIGSIGLIGVALWVALHETAFGGPHYSPGEVGLIGLCIVLMAVGTRHLWRLEQEAADV